MGIIALILGIAGQQLLSYGLAATGPILFVSPATATLAKDTTFDVEVRLDTAGQDVDGVEAFLTYPDDKLQFISISEAESAFELGMPSSGGDGKITIRRITNPEGGSKVSGPNLLVAVVTMSAMADSGTANIDYTTDSRVTAADAATSNVLSSTAGGSYTFTPTVTSPPSPAVTPPEPSITSAPAVKLVNQPNNNSRPAKNTAPASVKAEDANKAVTHSNSVVPPPASSDHKPIHIRPLPVLAKITGSFLLIGSFTLAAYLILALRRHQMAPATGIFYDSHFYHGATPTDNFDKRLESSQMSKHHNSATDEALSAIANPKLPEPGTSIHPSHNAST